MSRLSVVGPIHPLRGGIAEHTQGFVEEARGRGHEVQVVSYHRLYPGLLFPGRSQFSEEPENPPAARGALASIDSLRPLSWLRAAKQVSQFAPDIVFVQRWHPFFAPALATIVGRSRRRGARIVWMVHNAAPHEGGRGWGPLLGMGMRHADRGIVHAATEKEALRSRGVLMPTKVVPLPTFDEVVRADPAAARRRHRIEPDQKVFLFFGHVRPYKGVDLFLDALEQLAGTGPAWRALVVGEWYMDSTHSASRVRRPPLAGRVEIVDRFVSRAERAEFFALADVVVLPYRSGSQSAVVPLAYAHGRPVVSTRVGGLGDAVIEGETGLLVAPDDAGALAAALGEVLHGRAFSSGAIARAHRAASFSSLVDALEDIVPSGVLP